MATVEVATAGLPPTMSDDSPRRVADTTNRRVVLVPEAARETEE